MQNSPLGLFIFIIIITLHATKAFDISIEHPSGHGTYYRFLFIYASISGLMMVVLVISAIISMCRRYKLVASQEDEISELQ